ncbi:hypothetical protein DA798_05160 [Lactobacillus sp. PFC-70]|uniref:hypothetical protein n=1 Tax=Levilactobacillus namurensis TaxID=380393 RepID=UPI0004645574|nr:hypothetical protein [Levilactobacillus namurensis]PTM22990.1 hypothetical protein DA798_05160 [Lactobacillus sp. PFC-70]
MKKRILRGLLVGTVAVVVGSSAEPLLGMATQREAIVTAQASGVTSISQSQFTSDIEILREAVRTSSDYIRDRMDIGTINNIRDAGIDAYADGDRDSLTFTGTFEDYSYSLGLEDTNIEFNQDRQGILVLYRYFQDRFSASDNATLKRDLIAVDRDEDWEDQAQGMALFADDLAGAFNNYAQDLVRFTEDIVPEPVAVTPIPAPKPDKPVKFKKLTVSRYRRNAKKLTVKHAQKGARVVIKNQKHKVVKRLTLTKKGKVTIRLSKAQVKKLNKVNKKFTLVVVAKHHRTYTVKVTIK